MAIKAKRCENCEFAGDGIFADANTQSSVRIMDDGAILYAGTDYSECGLGMGQIVPEDVPGLTERLENCPGPYSEVVDAPARWPLGLLGFTKQVEARKCGAVKREELENVIEQHIVSCRG